MGGSRDPTADLSLPLFLRLILRVGTQIQIPQKRSPQSPGWKRKRGVLLSQRGGLLTSLSRRKGPFARRSPHPRLGSPPQSLSQAPGPSCCPLSPSSSHPCPGPRQGPLPAVPLLPLQTH